METDQSRLIPTQSSDPSLTMPFLRSASDFNVTSGVTWGSNTRSSDLADLALLRFVDFVAIRQYGFFEIQ